MFNYLSKMFSFSLLVVLLLCFWYYIRKRTMSVLIRGGIPGPQPNLLLGNVLQMGNMSPVDYQNKLIQKYGKVVGYYIGAQPTIIVTDVALIRDIQAKDFKNFVDRPQNDMTFIFTEKCHDGNLVAATGQRWRNTRNLMTPSFSPSKLKSMTPLIEESVNTFINIIGRNAEKGVEFNFYPLVQRFTAEVTIRTSFGIENNFQTDNKNQFFEDIQEFSAQTINVYLYLFINCFPCLFPLIYRMRRFGLLSRKNVVRIYHELSDIINLRRNTPNIQRNDILQALLESTIDDKDQEKLRLSENEVIANAFLIYGAGYDTTSNTLASLAHQLVNFPELQEMVRQEVQELYKSKERLDFHDIDSGLQYMECFIKETLRLYPPLISFISRQCYQDYKYKERTIPKGSTVIIAINSLHNDPEYWVNPDNFDPTRFRTDVGNKINPFSFQTFGEGPRRCIGMRLAFLVIKLALTKLLLHYRLEKGPNTEIGKMSTQFGQGTLFPKIGVSVKAVKI